LAHIASKVQKPNETGRFFAAFFLFFPRRAVDRGNHAKP